MASRSRPRSRARNCVSLAPVEAVRRRFLNVAGVSVEKGPQWRWRIVNGFGEILRESAASFPKNLPEARSEEHTSELQSQSNLVCRLLLEKKKKKKNRILDERLYKMSCVN